MASTKKVSGKIIKDNQEVIDIISSMFGGKFANFFKQNLKSEYSHTYDIANILFKATDFDSSVSDADQKAAKNIFYIIFYDSLLDYIYFKGFGIINSVKKNIPFIKSGSVSTGIPQYDRIIRDVFTEIAYSPKIATAFRGNIDAAYLEDFYNNLSSEPDFKSTMDDILTKRGGKIDEGILDKLFGGGESKRLKVLMENAVDTIPRGFFVRSKIIAALRNGGINDFLSSVTDHRRFVAKEYADPLNSIAFDILIKDFFSRWYSQIEPDLQDFFKTVVGTILFSSSSPFKSKAHKMSYSFFRQYAEFVYNKKANANKINTPSKTNKTNFKFKTR